MLCLVVYTCFAFYCISAVLSDRCWFCCSILTATVINEYYYIIIILLAGAPRKPSFSVFLSQNIQATQGAAIKKTALQKMKYP